MILLPTFLPELFLIVELVVVKCAYDVIPLHPSYALFAED